MFALIGDVQAYPEFLPWCAAARIRSRREIEGGEALDAELVISFKVFRERFGSRAELRRDALEIDVSYLDGPFKRMENQWRFRPAPGGGCDVSFHVDFEFRSRTLERLIGLVFHEAMTRVVKAFEQRARALYGPGEAV